MDYDGNFLAKKVVKSQNIFLFSSFLDNIECRVDYDGNQRGLCNQMMYVGYSALPPDNFTCISGKYSRHILTNFKISQIYKKLISNFDISDNWQSLNCTWDVPYNPIRTTYELNYFENGSGGR